ncbi:MAG: hypothetical protein R6U96_13090, partial [Promethearchaeia archaeon]
GVDDYSVYKVYRSEEKGFEISEEYLTAEINADERLKIEDKDIEPGKTYYYRIIIIDRVGHKSEPSTEVEAEIPANNLPIIIAVIVIGAIVGVAGVFVYRSVQTKKRDKLFSQVDLDEIEDKFDAEDIVEVEEPKWTQIETKPKAQPQPAPMKQEGFEFKQQKPSTSSTSIQSPQKYWKTQLGKLLNEAVSSELQGNFAKTLKMYRMILRISEKTGKKMLTQKIDTKIKRLYRSL